MFNTGARRPFDVIEKNRKTNTHTYEMYGIAPIFFTMNMYDVSLIVVEGEEFMKLSRLDSFSKSSADTK